METFLIWRLRPDQDGSRWEAGVLNGDQDTSIILEMLSQVISLSPPNTGGDLEASTAQYVRLVTWAPTGNAIAYVDYNNNIHYRCDNTEISPQGRITNDNFRATAEGEDEQVTTNGIDGQVYNGIPDWVNI